MAATLFDLPNEVLLQVLKSLSTATLFPVSATSRRLYALACRVLYNRLQLASQLPEHTLLLECYHPSAKLTEPPFYCTYVGTEGLDTGEGAGYGSFALTDVPIGRIDQYHKLYSVYRPRRRAPDEQARRLRHPAGDVPGSRTHPSSAPTWLEGTAADDVVRQSLTLDGHELFTQLIASLNLARSGPRRGLFFSFVDVCEGVVRVWRDWLKDAAVACDTQQPKAPPSQIESGKLSDDRTILWMDTAKRVGIRLKVRASVWPRARDMPVLTSVEEESPVSYEIEYQELIVRTSHLASIVEASSAQQSSQTGKAIVFGSFA